MRKLITLFLVFIASTALWASNVITYKATSKLPEMTKQHYSGLYTNAFNVAITSHEFADSIGIITFEGEVTSIGSTAFFYCTSLSSIDIPNSVTSIGDEAFEGCSSLTSIAIPNSVTSIGSNAFLECKSITSIAIPNSVIRIETMAFSGCTSLHSIDVDAGNTHYVSENGVLFNYAKDTLLQYPAGNSQTTYSIPNSVTIVCDGAFYNCISLTLITIPNSVTGLGEGAFSACSSLTSIVIPNSVTNIGTSAFSWCTAITSITIPNSVINVDARAFASCKSLTSVTIGNSVTSIGMDAFYDSDSISSITCYAITPPACDKYCFKSVDTSIPVYVPSESVTAYQSADEWKAFTYIQAIGAEPTIAPDSVITEPTDNSITITWPTNDSTYTYDLVVYDADGNIVCTVSADADGTVTGITYPAPSRGNYNVAAEEVAIGYKFTITGLNPATNYTYAVIYKDEKGTITHIESGEFTTTGSSTAINQLPALPSDRFTKVIKDGQLYILRDGKTYNAQGGEL